MDVLTLLKKENRPMRPAEIAKALKKTPEGVRSRLCRLAKEGVVARTSEGYYIPSDDAQDETSWLNPGPRPNNGVPGNGRQRCLGNGKATEAGNTYPSETAFDKHNIRQKLTAQPELEPPSPPPDPVMDAALEPVNRRLEVMAASRIAEVMEPAPAPAEAALACFCKMALNQMAAAIQANNGIFQGFFRPEPEPPSLYLLAADALVRQRLAETIVKNLLPNISHGPGTFFNL
ncbi:hypothetical protein SDD30_15955 [Moorella naiadis]|uniref:hypothetical protein n=1 Tax=Moorella naiadis (nom. illeg.) TaxID=3093670 RepID=UPI003D9C8842